MGNLWLLSLKNCWKNEVSDQRGNNVAKLGDSGLEQVNSSESNILHEPTFSNRIEHCWASKIAIHDSPVSYMISEKL